MDDGVFSPSGKGARNSIRFNIAVQDKTNIVQWQFTVADSSAKDNIIRKISGGKTLNDFIDWDGKNDKNEFAAEGMYIGNIEIKYLNGNISKAESNEFRIDVTPPFAEISLPYDTFSPDGNDIKDYVSIIQKSSEEKTDWDGTIYDSKNRIIKKYSWKKDAPAEVKWDGLNEEGKLMPDGLYFYVLNCTDAAGNKFESLKQKINIYTKRSPVSITPTTEIFSPDNNGIADTIKYKISAEADKDNPVTDWTVIIKDKDNVVINEEKRTDELPAEFIWNGLDDKGKGLAEGLYTAYVRVNFFYGTSTIQSSKPVAIDLTGPDITVERKTELFSPDSDGSNDELIFSFKDAKDLSGIKNWKLEILSPFTKKEFISFSGLGEPKDNIKWDGIGKNGKLVESVQDYPVKIIAEDNVGNISEKNLTPIPIDILVMKLDDGRYKIRISNINFQADSPAMTKDEKNKDILTKLTRALKKFPDYDITIEGYANEFKKGLNEKQAIKLSKDRAVTVALELQKLGINKDRLATEGKGFENPIIPLKPNMTFEEVEEMSANRRVEFYISK